MSTTPARPTYTVSQVTSHIWGLIGDYMKADRTRSDDFLHLGNELQAALSELAEAAQAQPPAPAAETPNANSRFAGHAVTDEQIKAVILQLDNAETFDADGVTSEAVGIVRALLAAAPAQAEEAKAVAPDAQSFQYLCEAWGECDWKEVKFVTTLAEAKEVIVGFCWNPASEATQEQRDNLLEGFDEKIEAEKIFKVDFEIGGVSVEKVVLHAAPAAQPLPPAANPGNSSRNSSSSFDRAEPDKSKDAERQTLAPGPLTTAENAQRAASIVAAWPDWKRDCDLTKYSPATFNCIADAESVVGDTGIPASEQATRQAAPSNDLASGNGMQQAATTEYAKVIAGARKLAKIRRNT